MKYCPNCGSKLKADAKFCDHCGYKLVEETTEKKSNPRQKVAAKPTDNLKKLNLSDNRWANKMKKRPKLTALVGIAAVMLVILGIVWYQNAHNVAKVVPGHAYRIKDSYIVFGKDGNDDKVVITSDKKSAIDATESASKFKSAYNIMTGNNQIKSASYSATKDSLKVDTKMVETDRSNEHSTDNGGDEIVAGSAGGVLTNDLLGPLAKAAGNMLGDALNSASDEQEVVDVDFISSNAAKVKGNTIQMNGKLMNRTENNIVLTKVK